MRELERRVVLSVLDRKWREHLYEMDYLREGIYLRAYSQRDPLVEYQREGFDMFAAMMDGIKEESVGFLFNLEVNVEEEDEDEVEEEVAEPMRAEVPTASASAAAAREAPQIQAKGLERPGQPQRPDLLRPRGGRARSATTRPRPHHRVNADDPFARVGRNDECPCGSGKKYKKCHGAPGGPTGLTARANGSASTACSAELAGAGCSRVQRAVREPAARRASRAGGDARASARRTATWRARPRRTSPGRRQQVCTLATWGRTGCTRPASASRATAARHQLRPALRGPRRPRGRVQRSSWVTGRSPPTISTAACANRRAHASSSRRSRTSRVCTVGQRGRPGVVGVGGRGRGPASPAPTPPAPGGGAGRPARGTVT